MKFIEASRRFSWKIFEMRQIEMHQCVECWLAANERIECVDESSARPAAVLLVLLQEEKERRKEETGGMKGI